MVVQEVVGVREQSPVGPPRHVGRPATTSTLGDLLRVDRLQETSPRWRQRETLASHLSASATAHALRCLSRSSPLSKMRMAASESPNASRVSRHAQLRMGAVPFSLITFPLLKEISAASEILPARSAFGWANCASHYVTYVTLPE